MKIRIRNTVAFVLLMLLVVTGMQLAVSPQPAYGAASRSSLASPSKIFLPSASLPSAPLPAATPHKLFLPFVGAGWCTGLRSSNSFGVQVYGATGYKNALFPSLQKTGAAWLRVPIQWNKVEPLKVAPSQYKWSSVDSALAAAKDGCYNVIATIDSAPTWAAQYLRAPINPAALGDFAQFASALVERYDGDGINDAPGSPDRELLGILQ